MYELEVLAVAKEFKDQLFEILIGLINPEV